MILKPPDWRKLLSAELIQKALGSDKLRGITKYANKDYVYWDKFKHYSMPEGFSPEEAWAFLKFSRSSSIEKSPVLSIQREDFSFGITKTMYQRLNYIDSNTSGFISTDVGKPTESQKAQMIISSLTEEAIASSQIEGANTSRKVAKEMLLSKRKARSRDEQMIINNYLVMQRLLDWKDLELSKVMLLDIQKNITESTLDEPKDAGRFRTDADRIHVMNRLTGEIIFTPPDSEFVDKELDRLIKYANETETVENFIHPVIKACILHFWMAYLHPFVDGNGRTARAIFYWFLLKSNYWMFQYLSVSRIIKRSKKRYDDSYIFSELDENDLTYFLSYKLEIIIDAILDFVAHYKEKLDKEKLVKKLSVNLGEYNSRQTSLLQYLNENKDATIDILTHQSKNAVAYETARADLLYLEKKNLVQRIKLGKKFIFVPNAVIIKNLLKI